MYRKALVPTDGSAFATEALTHVPRVAPQEVVLIAVVESVGRELARRTGIATDVPADVARDIEADAIAEARRQLREAEAALRAAGWAGSVVQVVRQGKPGPEIVATAAAEGCDLIIMATHGRSGLSRALVGSVANHVVAHSENAAVLLVRPEGAD